MSGVLQWRIVELDFINPYSSTFLDYIACVQDMFCAVCPMGVCKMENITPCKYAWGRGIDSFYTQRICISILNLKTGHGQELSVWLSSSLSLQGVVTFDFTLKKKDHKL